jgi:hypothetical protein
MSALRDYLKLYSVVEYRLAEAEYDGDDNLARALKAELNEMDRYIEVNFQLTKVSV